MKFIDLFEELVEAIAVSTVAQRSDEEGNLQKVPDKDQLANPGGKYWKMIAARFRPEVGKYLGWISPSVLRNSGMQDKDHALLVFEKARFLMGPYVDKRGKEHQGFVKHNKAWSTTPDVKYSKGTYNQGNTTFHDGKWYKVVVPSTDAAPMSGWVETEPKDRMWRRKNAKGMQYKPGNTYSKGDVVALNDKWFQSTKVNNKAPLAWVEFDKTTHGPKKNWSKADKYNAGDKVTYKGKWFESQPIWQVKYLKDSKMGVTQILGAKPKIGKEIKIDGGTAKVSDVEALPNMNLEPGRYKAWKPTKGEITAEPGKQVYTSKGEKKPFPDMKTAAIIKWAWNSDLKDADENGRISSSWLSNNKKEINLDDIPKNKVPDRVNSIKTLVPYMQAHTKVKTKQDDVDPDELTTSVLGKVAKGETAGDTQIERRKKLISVMKRHDSILFAFTAPVIIKMLKSLSDKPYKAPAYVDHNGMKLIKTNTILKEKDRLNDYIDSLDNPDDVRKTIIDTILDSSDNANPAIKFAQQQARPTARKIQIAFGFPKTKEDSEFKTKVGRTGGDGLSVRIREYLQKHYKEFKSYFQQRAINNQVVELNKLKLKLKEKEESGNTPSGKLLNSIEGAEDNLKQAMKLVKANEPVGDYTLHTFKGYDDFKKHIDNIKGDYSASDKLAKSIVLFLNHQRGDKGAIDVLETRNGKKSGNANVTSVKRALELVSKKPNGDSGEKEEDV